MHVRIALLAAPLLLANTDPAPIPPAMKAMLDAAMASGNEGEVATVAKYARATAPEAERLYAEGYVAQQKFATRPFWLRLNCLVGSALHIICFHFM